MSCLCHCWFLCLICISRGSFCKTVYCIIKMILFLRWIYTENLPPSHRNKKLTTEIHLFSVSRKLNPILKRATVGTLYSVEITYPLMCRHRHLNYIFFVPKIPLYRNSLVIQWLGLGTFTARGPEFNSWFLELRFHMWQLYQNK